MYSSVLNLVSEGLYKRVENSFKLIGGQSLLKWN